MAWRLRFVFGGVTYTVAAGVAFVYCQNYEYSHASYDITDGIYGTVFYSLTGLHGLHVIAGVAFLLLMY
jgi:heme/copper-type cytochrome/quinol oxidase subunit 3